MGDLVANIGHLRTLRVQIYVDEPELGRVAAGMPVEVTWDALPGRTGKGTVEKLPAEVTALGTRRVGEAISTIANSDLQLLPGTHVNVAITSQVVENGLTLPKEAIRSEHGQVGVYLLRHGRMGGGESAWALRASRARWSLPDWPRATWSRSAPSGPCTAAKKSASRLRSERHCAARFHL